MIIGDTPIPGPSGYVRFSVRLAYIGVCMRQLEILPATSETSIDNVITNILDSEVSVIDTAIGDHFGEEVVISGCKPKVESPTICIRMVMEPGNVDLDDALINNADSVKFLGIRLNKGLSWEDHIDQTWLRVSSEFMSCAIVIPMTSYKWL